MTTPPVLVTSVVIEEDGTLLLNGEPFPYYIAEDGPSIKPTSRSGLGEILIPVLVQGEIVCKEPQWETA